MTDFQSSTECKANYAGSVRIIMPVIENTTDRCYAEVSYIGARWSEIA